MADSTAPTAPAKTDSKVEASSDGNIKETVESILIAFILAVVFRAFVVEAFVIPTGSMAPTLMGAHMRYHCPDCGWQWTVNYSSGRGEDIDIPSFYATPEADSDGNLHLVAANVPVPIFCP